jgi:hypothetical protein
VITRLVKTSASRRPRGCDCIVSMLKNSLLVFGLLGKVGCETQKESEFNFLLLVAFWQRFLCVHTIRRPIYIYRDGMVVVDLGEILVPYKNAN